MKNVKKIISMIDPPTNITAQIVNAGVMAGIAFFSTLAGNAVSGIIETKLIVAAAISAGLAFFMSLGIQRGLTKPE